MDDFQGILSRDFGLRPQGKAAPMAGPKPSPAFSSGGSTWGSTRSVWDSGDEVLPTRPPPPPPASASSPSLDSIFDGFGAAPRSKSPPPPAASSLPVFDTPVYDNDIFRGVPGVTTSSSSSVPYDDVFGSFSSGHVTPPLDDLLESLGKKGAETSDGSNRRREDPGFDDLIPGFGGTSPPLQTSIEAPETNQKKPAPFTKATTVSMHDDPFDIFEQASTSSYPSSGPFSEKVVEMSRTESYRSEANDSVRGRTPLKSVRDSSPVRSFSRRDQSQHSFEETSENGIPQEQPAEYSDFDTPLERSGVHISEDNGHNVFEDQSPRANDFSDEIWLTIAEIPLYTEPTSAPPPSRPPPPLMKQVSFVADTKGNKEYFQESSRNYDDSPKYKRTSMEDDLDDFMGNRKNFSVYRDNGNNDEVLEGSAAAPAAAMKEAMNQAEAKFKHAKEVRERERARSREAGQQDRYENTNPFSEETIEKENRAKLEQEKARREREERELEQRRLEKERELELQRERENNRQAVERATREARERAAAEARSKAEREARQRVERAAVQRAQAEARERAAVEARERAQKAATEAAAAEARERAAAEKAAVEKAQLEARRRAERAAVERAAAEARERAAADAKAKAAAAAAAAANAKQQRPEDDIDIFFPRATSAPRQRDTSSDQSKGSSNGTQRTSSPSVPLRKTSSTTNFDVLSDIFGGPPSSEVFQEIPGESAERRQARFERQQRTQDRAAKALAEKNERDMQLQREQAERHRISETLDFKIKQWSAGKEGNLRALLSTLQYVIWPECGWQPVSLTDLITGASVKKVYRKATLCIHPDKVQQKGANIEQKYIAEKVFDILKEAWNKFNSEELF